MRSIVIFTLISLVPHTLAGNFNIAVRWLVNGHTVGEGNNLKCQGFNDPDQWYIGAIPSNVEGCQNVAMNQYYEDQQRASNPIPDIDNLKGYPGICGSGAVDTLKNGEQLLIFAQGESADPLARCTNVLASPQSCNNLAIDIFDGGQCHSAKVVNVWNCNSAQLCN